MENYIKLIFTVSLCAAVIKVAAPETTLKKYLNTICSLCMIAVIALPIYQAVSDSDAVLDLVENIEIETQSYDEIYNTYLVKGELDTAEKTLSADLCSAVGARNGSLSVRLDASYSNGEACIVGADVLIYSDAITVSPEKIKEYIRERISVDCRIIYM